ncbi:hypothetical protein RhiirA1_491694, partial [Rhizophagus irregularis]
VKVSIVLEELGIPYKVRVIFIKDDEHKQLFLINLSGKCPVEKRPVSEIGHVFESVIMIYLCEHYDPEKKLLPKDPVIQWVNIFFFFTQ